MSTSPKSAIADTISPTEAASLIREIDLLLNDYRQAWEHHTQEGNATRLKEIRVKLDGLLDRRLELMRARDQAGKATTSTP